MDFHGGLVMFLHGERPKHSSIWLNWHHGEPFEICGHDVNPHDIVLYEVGSDHWHAIIGLDSAEESVKVASVEYKLHFINTHGEGDSAL